MKCYRYEFMVGIETEAGINSCIHFKGRIQYLNNSRVSLVATNLSNLL